MYLVDTSVWIHALRPRGHPAIQERLRPLIAAGQAAITDWVILELMTGIRSDESKTRLGAFCSPLPSLSFDPSFWRTAWDLAASLRKKGFSPSAADCFIAAVAIGHRTPLIHLNGDLVWIANHSKLKSVDWARFI